MKHCDGIAITLRLVGQDDLLAEYENPYPGHSESFETNRMITAEASQDFEVLIAIDQNFPMYSAVDLRVYLRTGPCEHSEGKAQSWVIPCDEYRSVAGSYTFSSMVKWTGPMVQPTNTSLRVPEPAARNEMLTADESSGNARRDPFHGNIMVKVERGRMGKLEFGPEDERHPYNPPEFPIFAPQVATAIKNSWFQKLRSDNGSVITAVFHNIGVNQGSKNDGIELVESTELVGYEESSDEESSDEESSDEESSDEEPSDEESSEDDSTERTKQYSREVNYHESSPEASDDSSNGGDQDSSREDSLTSDDCQATNGAQNGKLRLMVNLGRPSRSKLATQDHPLTRETRASRASRDARPKRRTARRKPYQTADEDEDDEEELPLPPPYPQMKVKQEHFSTNVIVLEDDDRPPEIKIEAAPPAATSVMHRGTGVHASEKTTTEKNETARAKKRARLLLEMEEIGIQERRVSVRKQLMDLEEDDG